MLRLLFCGDFVCQSPESVTVDINILRLFQYADYISANFEAPIRGFGNPICKSGPSLIQSEKSPVFLESLGINIIQLANNHMMDQGKEGCEETIKAFSPKTSILGAGSFEDAYKLSIVEKDSMKIGLLCLVHKEFGTLGLDSSSSDYGTAWINHPMVNKTILLAKKQCDILIVLPHAGVEDVVVPLPEWRIRYKEFIDLGADAVIASHPHTPQGWEEYNGKMIYYSLGNFYFKSKSADHQSNWYKSLIVDMTIEDKRIFTKVHNVRFSETSISLISTQEAENYNIYLCNLLKDSNTYTDYLNKELMQLWPKYKMYLLRGLAAVSVTTNLCVLSHAAYGVLKGPDIPMMLNNFQCESHRWAIERMLKLQ